MELVLRMQLPCADHELVCDQGSATPAFFSTVALIALPIGSAISMEH